MFIWTKRRRRRSWRGSEMGQIMRKNKGGCAERRISREGEEGLIYDGMLSFLDPRRNLTLTEIN